MAPMSSSTALSSSHPASGRGVTTASSESVGAWVPPRGWLWRGRPRGRASPRSRSASCTAVGRTDLPSTADSRSDRTTDPAAGSPEASARSAPRASSSIFRTGDTGRWRFTSPSRPACSYRRSRRSVLDTGRSGTSSCSTDDLDSPPRTRVSTRSSTRASASASSWRRLHSSGVRLTSTAASVRGLPMRSDHPTGDPCQAGDCTITGVRTRWIVEGGVRRGGLRIPAAADRRSCLMDIGP